MLRQNTIILSDFDQKYVTQREMLRHIKRSYVYLKYQKIGKIVLGNYKNSKIATKKNS
jgi:hypothetical protein